MSIMNRRVVTDGKFYRVQYELIENEWNFYAPIYESIEDAKSFLNRLIERETSEVKDRWSVIE